MGFLRRLLGGDDHEARSGAASREDVMGLDANGRLAATEATFDAYPERERVTVWLRLTEAAFESPREQQRIFALEDRVMRALDAAGVGEHETNSLESGFFVMRLVGDDAAAIAALVEPLLEGAARGSYLAVRRGPAGSGEERIDVGPAAPGAA